MATYMCERCGNEVHYLVFGRCDACNRYLDSLKPGDKVKYRHGKGWGHGTFVDKYFADSYRVRTRSGREIVRRDLWPEDNP